MNLQQVLSSLPKFRYREELLSDDQSTSDIIQAVLSAHKKFAPDYDKIAKYFTGGDLDEIAERIFYFLKNYVRYNIETADLQTVRSPGGILEMGSGDCKHYAGFIAGVLDALKRRGKKINWYYRFASYDFFSQSPKHVFVIIRTPGREIWIDPVLSNYDDHSLSPSFYQDKTVKTMSLKQLSGFTSENTVSREKTQRLPGFSCMGLFDFDVVPPPPPPPDPSGDSGGGGSLIQTIQEGAQALAALLPAGGLKDWLNGFLKNPVQGLLTLITGKVYTSGDYHLGEVFLRNIIGNPDIQSRGQVPDSAVPPAWEFFTAALGVRIGSYDHMDALSKGAQAYFDWMKTLADGVTQAQADRGYKILLAYGFPANQSDSRRNMKWDTNGFAAIPYIFPLQGVAAGTLFSGKHPVLNVNFTNGYPDSQLPQLPNATPGGLSVTSNVSDFIKKNPVLALLIGGGVVWGISKLAKK